MAKDLNIQGQYRRAVAGVASVGASSSSPPNGTAFAGGGNSASGGCVACDICGLTLPRSATHQDVVSHPCYRGFSISVNAAGQIVLT